MRAKLFRAVNCASVIPAAAFVLLPALSGRALAGPPTVLKFEWAVPGHGYSLVAVHGPLQGVMGPGHFDVIVADPNAIWTNRLGMFTSATPVGAPMSLTVADRVTHLQSPHGEAAPWGPYVVAGPALLPPPGGLGVSFGVTAGAQNHFGGIPPHFDFSAGVVAATYGGSVDSIAAVLYVEAGIHDPPPGCTGRAATCSPANVVPPSGSGARGGAASTIHLGPNEFAVTVAVQGVQPSGVLSTNVHLGYPGDNGPVILALPGPWVAVTSEVSIVGFQGTFPQQYVPDLLAGRTYVQVNTVSFPQGAVRGQLDAPPLFSNSGRLNDPFMITRAGGHCSVNGDATDLLTALGQNNYGFGCQAVSNNAVADDFVVPPGQNWVIDGFKLDLYQTGGTGPTITSIDYAFSDTNLLGQLQPTWTTVPVTPAMSKVFRKLDTDQPSSGCTRRLQEIYVPLADQHVAGEGRHWLTWRATGSAAYTGPWQMPLVVPGQAQSPGANAMQSLGGQPYAYIADAPSPTQADLVFQLAGFGIGLPRLVDGTFDALAVGSPPDCAQAAGAWQFPVNYAGAGLCETSVSQYSIVPTGSFQSGAPGNSLALNATDNVNNSHLTNILPRAIVPGPGQTVRAEFDIWVQPSGGGGSVYIGADMGGGGYSNASDRGPQLHWWGNGTISYNVAGISNVVVQSYPRGGWQHVRLDMHLDTSNFDLYWTPPGGSQQTLGTGLGFRVTTPITMIDRFSIAHFGGTVGLDVSNSFFDNVSVAQVVPIACYPNCDQSSTLPVLNVLDFACFLNKFAAGDPYANCDGSTTVPVLNVLDFACFLNRFAAGCS